MGEVSEGFSTSSWSVAQLVCVVLDAEGAIVFPIVGLRVSFPRKLQAELANGAGDVGSSDRQGSILSSMGTCECGVPVGCVSAMFAASIKLDQPGNRNF